MALNSSLSLGSEDWLALSSSSSSVAVVVVADMVAFRLQYYLWRTRLVRGFVWTNLVRIAAIRTTQTTSRDVGEFAV